MGKYAKIALVLLYAVQLGVTFRDQVVHLYKQAIDMVHRDVAVAYVTVDVPEYQTLKRSAPPLFDAHEILAAPFIAPLALGDSAHDAPEDGHPTHNDDDKNKDRVKKERHIRMREIVYANLFQSLRTRAVHPSAQEPRAVAQSLAIAFPYTTHCAA